MSNVAKTYTRLMIILGMAVLLPQLNAWNNQDPVQYLSYFTLALLASVLQVGYHTELGVVPINLLFVLITLRSLSPAETMVLAAASALAQHWFAARNKPHRVMDSVFSMSVICVAVALADYASHGVFIKEGRRELNDALRAVLTGSTFFVGISFPWATKEALETRVKMPVIWKNRYFWMLPFYVAGSVLAGIFDIAKGEVGWQLPVLAVPVIFLLYRSYRIYMGRLEDGRSHAEEMASLYLQIGRASCRERV